MPYPYSSPFLEDDAEFLGLSNGYEPYSSDSEGIGSSPVGADTPVMLPQNLSNKFIAPKLGEIPGFVGDDMRLPIMRQDAQPVGGPGGMMRTQPPVIDQSSAQAYSQHMATSPYSKKPGFWNKLAAGLYGGASVLAATQAQPHITRVNPGQIAAGVNSILRPGQGRAMQEWDLKRRGLEDAARLEAMNNATKMRQYGIDSQEPLNQSRIEMNRKHGDLYDAIGYSRLFSALNPKQTQAATPTTLMGIMSRRAWEDLNSNDPERVSAGNRVLDWAKHQYELRSRPTKNRMEIEAYMQPYLDPAVGFDPETAEKFAILDWAQDDKNQQELRNTESTSRTNVNNTKSDLNKAQTNKIKSTPVGGSNNSAKAAAETVRKGKALAESLRDQADNDPTKALAILAEMGSGIPDPVRVHAKSILMDRRDKKSKDDDIMSFVDQESGTEPTPVSKPASKPASKPTSKPAAPSKPATSNNYTRKVWDAKTGDFK